MKHQDSSGCRECPLTERQLRRGVHRSTKELKAAINDNREPKPFIWYKTADQILDSGFVNELTTQDTGNSATIIM
jgi:hypothetical protein